MFSRIICTGNVVLALKTDARGPRHEIVQKIKIWKTHETDVSREIIYAQSDCPSSLSVQGVVLLRTPLVPSQLVCIFYIPTKRSRTKPSFYFVVSMLGSYFHDFRWNCVCEKNRTRITPIKNIRLHQNNCDTFLRNIIKKKKKKGEKQTSE